MLAWGTASVKAGFLDFISEGMCGICAVSLSIIPLSVFLIVVGAARLDAVLTSETFTFGLHGWIKTLRLCEIVRGSIRYYYPFIFYSWGVHLTDSSGRVLFMPIGRWAAFKFDYNIFDYRKMPGDILARLPTTAAVEEGCGRLSPPVYSHRNFNNRPGKSRDRRNIGQRSHDSNRQAEAIFPPFEAIYNRQYRAASVGYTR